MVNKIKKHFLKTYLPVFLGLIVLFSIATSRLYFEIGNIFFGNVPVLYNVTLAQVFFQQASYPFVGKASKLSHHQFSRTYFIQGDLDQALTEAKKEIELYPENIKTYYIIGLTLGYMNREQEAVEAFGKYLEANPYSWAARNDRAWLQFRIGDIDGAIETIVPVSHVTENAWVQNTYGTLLMNKKQYKEARVAFEYAKKAADVMTDESWGRAYPGNDPRIYGVGLRAMRISIEENLKLLDEKEKGVKKLGR